MDEFRILSPTAILGYGFPETSFANGMKKKPHMIGVDAGSSDPGPYYLGSGKSFTQRDAVRRDLKILLRAAVDASIPLVIGTAGGSGARPHVDWAADIVREAARELDISFRMGVIYADMDRNVLTRALNDNRIRPLGPVPDVTEEDIAASRNIVAQMGQEPVFRAFDKNCQVILCGRCYDPVAFAARPVQLGFPAGPAYHLGKILECAAIAATPGSGADCVMGTVKKDRFILEPLCGRRRFTRTSTAAHTLYEKENPYRLKGPDGEIDLKDTKFTEIDNQRVEVRGTKFKLANRKTVKLEGACLEGYRTIFIAGVRDPVFIAAADNILADIRQLTAERFDRECPSYKVVYHIYGKDGVMGSLEPMKKIGSHEIGLVVEVIATTQEEADNILGFFRTTLLHYGYPGRISTAGNLALLYSPSDISCGEVYRFNIHHLLTVKDSAELFPLFVEEVNGE